MPTPRGLVFDLDGTLVDSDKAYAAALRAVGIDPLGAPYAQARQAVKRRLGPGNPAARNRLLYFKELWCTPEHRPQTAPDVLTLMHQYENHLVDHIRAQWLATERQQMLAPILRCYPAIILTNENTRTQLLKWRAMDGACELFIDVVTSEEIGVEKPHPAMFAAACQRLNLPPQACLMVGDSTVHDIAPALLAGMQACHTVEFCDNPPTLPDVPILASLSDLAKLLPLT